MIFDPPKNMRRTGLIGIHAPGGSPKGIHHDLWKEEKFSAPPKAHTTGGRSGARAADRAPTSTNRNHEERLSIQIGYSVALFAIDSRIEGMRCGTADCNAVNWLDRWLLGLRTDLLMFIYEEKHRWLNRRAGVRGFCP
jgi:hypothetical protein